jgi:DNA-binding PadR family transcriptional regulator
MRTLKYAILGLVSEKPMTGYDIYKAFEGSIGNFWSAKHSQIYPELKKLTTEKLLQYDIAISGAVKEKKVYTITKEGLKELDAWLREDEPLEPTAKDVFRLRMFFCSRLSHEETYHLLLSQKKKHEDKLAYLEDAYTSRYSHQPVEADLGDFLVLSGAISRERAYIDWLKDCLPYFHKSKMK